MIIEEKDVDRFHTKYKIDGNSGCWEWQASKNCGYGQINIRGKMIGAHRVSAKIYGLDMSKSVIRHSCNNPGCVNPAHLMSGSQKDNMSDMYNANRQNKARGSKSGMSKLIETEVFEIRRLYSTGQYTCQQLGDKFGISRNQINLIVNRKVWKHLEGGA